jgi:glycosyltransferase involved in cell wall biosynthesis
MNKPKVSIIVPVYNTESYLYRCLDSIINQTLGEIEIICINDCSSDNSLKILKEYESKDQRVKLIDFEQNQGVSVARNYGINDATGEYIGFVDSDDYIDKNFYEVLYRLAKKESADIAKGSHKRIYNQGISRDISENEMINHNKYNFYFCFWSAIYNKDIIISSDSKFVPRLIIGEDLTFLIQAVYNANKVVTTDGVFYNYTRRENSTDSTILSIKKIQSVISTRTFIVEYINKVNISPEDYLIIFSNHFISLLSLPKRVAIENRYDACRSVAACLMDLYVKCKYKDEFTANKRYLSKYLVINDFDGFVEYLGKSKKEQTKEQITEQILNEFRKKTRQIDE